MLLFIATLLLFAITNLLYTSYNTREIGEVINSKLEIEIRSSSFRFFERKKIFVSSSRETRARAKTFLRFYLTWW